VRAQGLGARSREKRSREVPRSSTRDMWQNCTVGPEKWTSGHTSDIRRSQHPIDLSCLGYSGEKGTKVRAFDSRSCEKREREEKSQISPLGGSGKKVPKVEPLNSRRCER
jgi:hypothetical protein